MPKPPYTHPRNYCGLCCQTELCPAGEKAFPDAAVPCPALVTIDGKALCGLVLVETAARLEPIIAKTLGVGCGCSMPDACTTDEQIEAFDRQSYEAIWG